jgi:excisionase family DNA binding protein
MKKFLSVDELAAMLGVAKTWLYDRTAKNTSIEAIPHVRFGKYIRFDSESEEFHKWLSRSADVQA